MYVVYNPCSLFLITYTTHRREKRPCLQSPPLVWLTAGAQRTKYHDDNRAEAKEYIQRGSKGEGDTR